MPPVAAARRTGDRPGITASAIRPTEPVQLRPSSTISSLTNDLGQLLRGAEQPERRASGPYYRYESGTSMAAAAVSGTLALMQEFFEQQLRAAPTARR